MGKTNSTTKNKHILSSRNMITAHHLGNQGTLLFNLSLQYYDRCIIITRK